jgi:hypothetical protein
MTQEQANQPTAAREAPREYTLKGRHTSITYTHIPPEAGATPGLHIQSRLVFQGEGGDAKTFTGNELQVQNTVIGMQVTVILSRMPDTPTQVLTLLLPEIAGNVDGQSFTALALLTENLATAFLVHRDGALHYYEVIPLQGTVKQVFIPL